MHNWVWVLPVLSAATTYLLLRWMLAGKSAQWALDHPNHRSLHHAPVPRTGGVAIMVAVLVSWGLLGLPWLLCGGLLLSLLSLVDDIHGLPVKWRFAVHFAVAAGWVWWLPLHLSFLYWGMLVVGLVWMTNLYNFMDGSDGLAGGMAFFGFGTYALASWIAGDDQLALANAVIAASAIAFLTYNFHPARVFMGDAGSIPLGFLSGVIGLLGWQRGLWPLWFPVAVFSPFVADATVTLVKRLLRGEKIWHAHRSHYYQRLVQMGLGHRRTALLEYLLMLAVAGSAIVSMKMPLAGQLAFGLFWGLAYCALALWIDQKWIIWQKRHVEFY